MPGLRRATHLPRPHHRDRGSLSQARRNAGEGGQEREERSREGLEPLLASPSVKPSGSTKTTMPPSRGGASLSDQPGAKPGCQTYGSRLGRGDQRPSRNRYRRLQLEPQRQALAARRDHERPHGAAATHRPSDQRQEHQAVHGRDVTELATTSATIVQACIPRARTSTEPRSSRPNPASTAPLLDPVSGIVPYTAEC